MAKKTKGKKRKDEDEEDDKPTKKKKKKGPSVKEGYATNRQPLWAKDPEWDHLFQLDGDGNDGQRAYLYRERGFMVIANKDWEKDGDTVPGKSLKVSMENMDSLLTQYLKKVYGYDFKLQAKADK